jgi:DNA (cytosine-5)-methyltransferase 1
VIKAVDLFCGAGGTSTGLAQACRDAGVKVDLLAINHWQIAIDSHSASHPWARHMCASLEHVRPADVVPGGRLHLLVASPECTHHARARGGRPMQDQSRATAWHIVKFAQEVYIDNILIENVPEFRDWGPLGADGKPLKSKKGETFQAFIGVLKSLGYTVDHRVLNAADYGDPTTRKRLFIIARRGGKPIVWPEPTHSPTGAVDLFGGKQPYRTARKSVIDWELPNPSIFDRRKPLAPTTMARIIAGLHKFNPQLEPFIVSLRQHSAARSVEEPVSTVTGGGTHLWLCEPFLVNMKGKSTARDIDEPLATQTTRQHQYLCEPFVEPFLVQAGGPLGKARQPGSVDDPLSTVMTENHTGVVEPVLVTVTHGKGASGRPRTTDAPLPSVTTHNGIGVAEAFVLPLNRPKDQPSSVEETLRTVTATSSDMGLVEPFLTKYRLDIRFRMLQPHELARAQGFPEGYKFQGNKSEIVKQIGNAVPVHLAKALCGSLLADYAKSNRDAQLERK